MTFSKYIMIIIFIWFITGCAHSISNLAPAQLTLGPKVEAYLDPSFKPESYRTFSVFPFSVITKKQESNPILEKQMLFALRNAMEALGYVFVTPDSSADLLITINATMDYKEFHVPAHQESIPRWVPDQVIRSDVDSAYGSSTITTTVPGYLTSETYTVSEYTTGSYYPAISVAAYDRRTSAMIWWGDGAGSSENNDIRIASQFVLKKLVLANFPKSAFLSELTTECKGEEGLSISIFTIDGNNYYPTVMYVVPGSPAKDAGIEKNDFILAINGTPTVNKSSAEIRALQCGNEGEKLTLRLVRAGKEFDASMIRVNKDKLNMDLK